MYPDISVDLAKKHGRSHGIAKLPKDVLDSERCPCCKHFIDVEELSLCCDVQEFSICGEGYPLYFKYIQFSSNLFYSFLTI